MARTVHTSDFCSSIVFSDRCHGKEGRINASGSGNSDNSGNNNGDSNKDNSSENNSGGNNSSNDDSSIAGTNNADTRNNNTKQEWNPYQVQQAQLHCGKQQ